MRSSPDSEPVKKCAERSSLRECESSTSRASSGIVRIIDGSTVLPTSPWKDVFSQPWYRFFRRQILIEKLHNRLFNACRPLTVGMAITEDNEMTPRGDYYTAKGLGKELSRFGYTLKYLPRTPGEQWYDLPDDIDVLVVLVEDYDLTRISRRRQTLKIAWVRNCVEYWTGHEWFKDYDLILASSEEARKTIRERTGKESESLMIGADTEIFHPLPPQERYSCDIVFAGNNWGPREISSSLKIQQGWKCNIYGANWDRHESFRKYWKDFIRYTQLPYVYSSSKIVLDDHISANKPFGTINSRVFEAMACGCCVVTNAAKDIERIFPEGSIAVYRTSEELTRILSELLSNDERRKRMGQLAREAILSHHTYKKRAEQFRKILLSVAEKVNH